MEICRKNISFLSVVLFVAILFRLVVTEAFAHDIHLSVDYDDCQADSNSDGLGEMWYLIDNANGCYHLSDEITTIKYYFAESSPSGYTWTTDISKSVAEQVKNAYAISMKKWNNVYFYSHGSDDIVSKHKIINIVEGTPEDHNLIIYPGKEVGSFALTEKVISSHSDPGDNYFFHNHYNQWTMTVYLNPFFDDAGFTPNEVNLTLERTGAHELGHVLGLRDIDYYNSCNANAEEEHHFELLMGYGFPITQRASNITYKDIAGVAITRGFHTDSDHK